MLGGTNGDHNVSTVQFVMLMFNQEAEAMSLSFTQWKRQSTTICSVLGNETLKFHFLYSMVIRNSFPSALWSFFFFFNHFFPYALLFSSLKLHLNICHYATVMVLMTVTNLGHRSTIYADFLSYTLSLLLNSVFKKFFSWGIDDLQYIIVWCI